MTKLAQTETPVLVWDYASIADEAPTEIIQAAAVQIKTVLRRTAENVIELGKLLTAVKNNLPHGCWQSWLTDEIGVSTSTASNWLRAYQHADQFRAIANLNPTAIYALAGEGVSAEAIEKANQLAESGQTVTRADVESILAADDGPVEVVTVEPITEPDRDPAETDREEIPAPADVDHDRDRTRLAPEPAGSTGDRAVEMKLARAAWLNLARLAVINEGGALAIAREAWHELKASGELTLGDNDKPCDQTLKAFLEGAVDDD
jgi:hypothetical protein